ncbi:phosphoribosyl-ATP diphosphatase [Fodinicurvata halophila]|uniref:Phosphoribosyl-ATP pyrophosphatase n=1 Tax=Fodinicurvata halophila TaxID=1419723 RepID=A0ABV8UP90_9PROT
MTKDKAAPDSALMLDELYEVIAARRNADPESSYTAKLFAKGETKIAQKLGEEAVETVIAALKEDRQALAAESADLLYHLLVLWAEKGVTPDEVWAKLRERKGTSGLAEKEARSTE